ncbi:PAP2 domain-containing protein [Purpureocillium lilacinum]|uniref:PAP2 domain-containing protein n=1 Tax=Purpureocillium lilacinum TaxID=33203 RepID=A0A179G3D1_PURLI|nr:PAP2 domain-containing protein [Purpureocillium lilacinum]OAQ71881.1 PAP2 domain-containing protein [Purpureocillium lilacinum]
MAHSGSSPVIKWQFPVRLLASYTLDWIILVVVVIAGGFLGRITPNKRPFALDDPGISFPYADHETVPTWLLVVLSALVPVVIISIVSILLIPGGTVPKKTPISLIWRLKLWELHVGWLGLLMAVGSAFFFVSGIKNMCGKPRPDLLSRCQPDLADRSKYRVGGFDGQPTANVLYSGDICKQTDKSKLDDGFRSYPSGHSAAAAAGLIYLSLFLASKFSVTIPFVVLDGTTFTEASTHVAFPSLAQHKDGAYEPARSRSGGTNLPASFPPVKTQPAIRNRQHNAKLQSMRRQAAAPPVYLLVIVLAPFCLAIFISASRWFDFRHHGFDILFGFLIGMFTAIYSFRYYHLPIMSGAGWAWGPRSEDRAFWAGVGRLGYVGTRDDFNNRVDRSDQGESGDVNEHSSHGPAAMSSLGYRVNQYGEAPPAPGRQQAGPYETFEMNDIAYRQ